MITHVHLGMDKNICLYT